MIELIAEKPEAVNHIKNNWEKGDTVTLAGIVNMTYEVKTWMEEQGFGEPIERRKTVSKKELIITSGSPSGLDEDYSYDNDAIKIALEESNYYHNRHSGGHRHDFCCAKTAQ